MTRTLEHGTFTNNLYSDLETPPLLETTNGGEVGQRLNIAADALTHKAEELGLKQDSDGLYIIGDLSEGEYIAVGHDSTDGNAATTLYVVTKGNRFYCHVEAPVAHNPESAHCRVHREHGGIAQDVEFSGRDTLDGSAVTMTRELATAFVDVADTQHKHGQLSDEALSDIVTPLITPESSTQRRSKSWFGGATLRRLFVRRPAA